MMYWSANKPGLKLYQTRGEISQINLNTMIIEYIGSSFSYHITFGEILIFSRFGHYSWWRCVGRSDWTLGSDAMPDTGPRVTLSPGIAEYPHYPGSSEDHDHLKMRVNT